MHVLFVVERMPTLSVEVQRPIITSKEIKKMRFLLPIAAEKTMLRADDKDTQRSKYARATIKKKWMGIAQKRT